MKRVKTKKQKDAGNKIIQIKAGELKRWKERESADATKRAGLLFLSAMRDVLKLDEDQLMAVIKEASNYAKFYDQHLVDMADMAKVCQKVGVDITVGELRNLKNDAGMQCLAGKRIIK